MSGKKFNKDKLFLKVEHGTGSGVVGLAEYEVFGEINLKVVTTFATSGTLTVQGRIHHSDTWESVGTLSSGGDNDTFDISAMDYIRLNFTVAAGSTGEIAASGFFKGATASGGGATNSFTIMQTDAGTSPTADSATDTLTFTSADGTVIITGDSSTDTIDLSTTGSDAVVISAKVNEVGGVTVGQVLYISGATGGFPQVSVADNTDFSTATILAVANEAKADGQTVAVTISGMVDGIDTSAFSEGDILYLGTTGALTATHPTGINAVQRVGFVVKVNASTGSILIELNPLTVINDHDGIVRHQLVNQNAGTSASAAYTVVNNADHRSSFSMIGSNYTAIAGLAEALVIYNEGYNKTVNAVDGNFGFEWWTDITGSHNLSSTAKMLLSAAGELLINGTQKIVSTATTSDVTALEIDCDAAGFGDVEAIDIDYITGAIGAGDEEAAIVINVDETLSTGGELYGLEILTTAEGSVEVIALKAGVNVLVLDQHVGTFGDTDSFLVKAVDQLAAVSGGGAGNITLFVADNDTITIGDAAQFDEIEIILDTGASGSGISPTFEFSTGVGTWTAFSPTDGTSGFRNTGLIAYQLGDIPSWAVGTGSEYLIRITRTKNSLTTAPIIDLLQIAATVTYCWDKNADVNCNSLFIGAPRTSTITTDATLEVKGTDGAFLPPTLTTTQRDALTATAGMQIYNSTTGTTQNYVSGAWADIGGGGGTEDITFTSSAAGTIPLTLGGSASQTGDMLLIEDSASAELLSIDSNGAINVFKGASHANMAIICSGEANSGIAFSGTGSSNTIYIKAGSTARWDFGANGITTYSASTQPHFKTNSRGTNLVPMYSFNNDRDCGMYCPSANNLAFTSGGVQGINMTATITELKLVVELSGIPTYADEAAAVTGGIGTDEVYKTSTGELRIKL